MRKLFGGPSGLMAQRIRNRRESLGLAAIELARRARISPSYLSLIEKGAKLPSLEIALRLARALDDDPDLYRAWVDAAPHEDLPSHVRRLNRLEKIAQTPDLSARVRRGEAMELSADLSDGRVPTSIDPSSASSRARRWGRRARKMIDDGARSPLSASETPAPPQAHVSVPMLAAGAQPGEERKAKFEMLTLDARMIPPGHDPMYAYRPDAEAVQRVRGQIGPGDLVVYTTAIDFNSSAIYAVAHEGKVLLSRIALHGDVLMLLPGDETQDPITIQVSSRSTLGSEVRGRVLATVRWWAGDAAEAPSVRPAPRGRNVRLEDDFVVRDCEWRDRYGWRPIQRPEDLAYLETHPDTKIRFRLIKDGRVRFLLEMGPDEWRSALGSYVDGPAWERNGYIVAITRREGGEYGLEFQERWAPYVRPAGPGD